MLSEEGKEVRRKARDKFLKTIKVGSTLYTSWGYDQTNVEFFQVISKKGCAVTIQEIAQKQDGDPTSHDSCRVVPLKDDFIGEPIKKRVMSAAISLGQGYRYLQLWDGKSKHTSWGH